MLAYCFWRFISGDTECLNASSIGNKALTENTDSSSSPASNLMKLRSLAAMKPRVRVATWLILPVVIRSSQRLSHACLSINILLWNCEWLIISVIVYLIVPYYLDNRSNSRANICIKAELSGTAVFISIKPSLSGVDLVSHNNLSNCMHMLRQWIIQVSALSAWDGSVLDYHGFNG